MSYFLKLLTGRCVMLLGLCIRLFLCINAFDETLYVYFCQKMRLE